MAPGKDLTPRQALFVLEYLKDLNATQAAIRAGFSAKTAEQIGYQQLQRTSVAAEIKIAMDARAQRTGITIDRVLEELGRVGFSDMRMFAEWDGKGVELRDSATLDNDAARCVAELAQTSSKDGGSIRFKLHDKVGALEKIGKHLGMFIDQVEDVTKIAPEQRRARILEIVRSAARRRKQA